MNFIQQLFNTFTNFFNFTTGGKGHILIDDSYTGKGIFKVIIAANDLTITYTNLLNSVTITTLAIPAGYAIYGNLTNITIASGGEALGYII